MDASILLVGSEDFLATFTDRVHHLVACSVNSAPSAAEAMPLIQAQQPDLVLIQAEIAEALDLCRQVKGQTRLAWIYCILLDHWLVLDAPSQANSSLSHLLALANGADAYLARPAEPTTGELVPMMEPLDVPAFGVDAVLSFAERMLQVQIYTGLRMVRTHRELMRTNDILSAIALADPLTELNNRRALDWELPRQVQNARSRTEPLSVLMIDVDFFKSINDTYGHGAGDRVLQLIANRLRHNLRFRDTLFRYGGEEFVIILSATDQYEGLAVAKRLCVLINAHSFTVDTLESPLDLPITISIGAATLEDSDDGKGISLLKRADQNLLRAKAEGRNQALGTIDDAELEAHLATMVEAE